MEGRLALKRPHGEKHALNFVEGFHYRGCNKATQPFNMTTKSRLTESKVVENRTTSNFTGSLAEVYEKALNNVLSIQPNLIMDEKLPITETKPPTVLDPQYFRPPSGSNQLRDSTSRTSDDKKLNQAEKSAFHVPEKRCLPREQSPRYRGWSRELPFPYTVNYPSDYYPVAHMPQPAFQPRYENPYFERFNCFPQRREFPVFTHVLPWLQFERDHHPMTSPPKKSMSSSLHKPVASSPRNKIMTSSRSDFMSSPPNKHTSSSKFMTLSSCKPITSLSNELVASIPGKNEFANQRRIEDASSENTEQSRMRDNHEKYNKSPDFVKTRRMRAIEKKQDLCTSKTDSFGSPKEEFLFGLGLARVHACI